MRKLLIFSMVLAMATMSYGQESDKLSVTTQMFLQELRGELSFQQDLREAKKLRLKAEDGTPVTQDFKTERLYAKPDTIDGQVYIAAYVRLDDPYRVSEVESLGVIVQSSFKDGHLLTTLIPIDKIEELAALANVSRINVSPLKKSFTNKARYYTNVDDVLTYSADAQSAGLPSAYNGTGVVLGVIDTGIDFNHIAFKDKSGNSRIKRAYVYDGSSAKTYTSITNSSLTDDNTGDHGTHTSTTAGGSSVIINGSTVTVTDDPSQATYGGMAPGADLYLAGINGLSSTYLDNAVNNIISYAEANGQPVVVSNSWGSQIGPHDGTGDEADVYNSLFGPSHPNRVALFAASNDGGKSKDNEGGGYHVSGTATSSSPLRSILRAATYSNTDAGYYYYGIIANAWARSTSVSSMTCKIYVLDASTGAVKTSVTVNPSSNGTSVSGLSSYFSGTLYAYKDYISSDKTQIMLYTSGLTSRSTSSTTKNGEKYYTSNYTLAVEFAPSSGSSVIDVWGGSYGYFTNHLTTSGYTWTAGSDDMCVSDEATIENVISIGAYVSMNTYTDYSGTSHDYTGTYTMGDIAYFSSYATADQSPTGLRYPWITAPGARLVAGVNHNHTASVDDYSYYDTYSDDLIVNSSTSPYAAMEGTSMATPTAAGIVALWLQVASENDVDLTSDDIKTIMKETAITDAYTTTGANASHFGNGKIDALAGIEYILNTWCKTDPTITATPAALAFDATYSGETATKQFTVKGAHLTGAVTATLSDADGVFSLSDTSVSASEATDGKTITVTFAPQAAKNYSATVTLTSAGAESVTVTLTGTGLVYTPAIYASSETVTFDDTYVGENTQKTVSVSGTHLEGAVTATLSDADGVFSLSDTSVSASEATDGKTITVTFAPQDAKSYSATVTLTSAGAESVTVTLTGTGKFIVPEINVSKSTLTFGSTVAGETATQTFTVTGTHLEGDITLTLDDEENFALSTGNVAQSTAEGNGAEVTVTFVPQTNGSHAATVTLSSSGAEDVVVTINGTATYTTPAAYADENYIAYTSFRADWSDITPDAGIDSYTLWVNRYEEPKGMWLFNDDFSSWSAVGTSRGNNISYTNIGASLDDYFTESGWTCGSTSSYGVYSYAGYMQIGYKSNGGSSNNRGGLLSGPAADLSDYDEATVLFKAKATRSTTTLTVALMNSSGTAISTKTQSITTTETAYTMTFDTSTAEAGSYFQFSNESGYPIQFSYLKAYAGVEPTTTSLGGALTASVVETGDADTRTVTGITDKHYVVRNLTEGGTYDFKVKATYTDGSESSWSNTERVTLVDVEGHTLATMVADNTLDVDYPYSYVSDNLLAVALSEDRRTLFCKDDNEYAEQYSAGDLEDYVKEYAEGLVLSKTYDQSNWVALTLDEENESEFDEDLVGNKLGKVSGRIADLDNPVVILDAMPTTGATKSSESYLEEANLYIPCNFTGAQQTGSNGIDYFFMTPKPMEIAVITWALWDAQNQKFIAVPHVGSMNPFSLTGEFTVSGDLMPLTYSEPRDGYVYQFTAVIHSNSAPQTAATTQSLFSEDSTTDDAYTVYPISPYTKIGEVNGGVVTGIEGLTQNGKEVKEIRFIDASGRIAASPWSGFNIIETIYTDGTSTIEKVRR